MPEEKHMSDEITNTNQESTTEATATQEVAPSVAPAPAPAPAHTEQPRRGGYDHGRRTDSSHSDRPDSPAGDAPRVPKFRRKSCRFCGSKDIPIEYKRPDILEKFITERGKILPRRVTGTCARHQRAVAREIKRARTVALLPFVEK
jgi:small subunit ribosomal protein S18